MAGLCSDDARRAVESKQSGFALAPPAVVIFFGSMGRKPSMNEVREAIGGALYGISAYDLEQVCDALGMPPQPEGGADPFASKRSYINRRLIGCSLGDLLSFVGKIADEYGD